MPTVPVGDGGHRRQGCRGLRRGCGDRALAPQIRIARLRGRVLAVPAREAAHGRRRIGADRAAHVLVAGTTHGEDPRRLFGRRLFLGFLLDLAGGLHAQQALLQIEIAREFVRRQRPRDTTVQHHRDVVGHFQGHAQVLLDQQYRDIALLDQGVQHARHLLDDDRCQTFGRLVHHQQTRVEQQRTGDRKHLLLAAGQLRATVAAPFRQARKGLVDAVDGPRTLRPIAAYQAQMLVDAEGGPHAPPLRHETDTPVGHAIGRQAENLLAAQLHAAAGRDEAHDRVAQRGLAHAVAADHCQHTVIQRQRDPLERMGTPVVDVEVPDLENRCTGAGHAGRSLGHQCLPR